MSYVDFHEVLKKVKLLQIIDEILICKLIFYVFPNVLAGLPVRFEKSQIRFVIWLLSNPKMSSLVDFR